MPTNRTNGNRVNATSPHLGFEATPWTHAEKLHGSLDASECKHVLHGRIFLKYNRQDVKTAWTKHN